METHPHRAWVAEQAILAETDVTLLDGFDEAIIGVATVRSHLVVVYDRDKMLSVLTTRDGGSLEEAEEHLSYNTERTVEYLGEGAPIIVSPYGPWN